MHTFLKSSLPLVPSLLLGFSAIALFILVSPVPGFSASPIHWEPKKIEETVAQGHEKTKVVSFTTKKDLTDVVVWIVPELQPYVSAVPSSFSSISKGDMVTLTLTLSAPTDAPLETFDGTLHLRSSSGKSNETYAKPMPVMLTTILPTAQVINEGLAITFNYSPGWTISPEGSKRRLYSPAATTAIANGDLVTPPDITITIIENPSSSSLSDFLNTYQEGWFAVYKESIPITIDGHEGIRVSDLTAEIPSIPGIAVFVDVDDMIVLVTGHYNTQQQFDTVIASLEFS
jgi:hypothetical protein